MGRKVARLSLLLSSHCMRNLLKDMWIMRVVSAHGSGEGCRTVQNKCIFLVRNICSWDHCTYFYKRYTSEFLWEELWLMRHLSPCYGQTFRQIFASYNMSYSRCHDRCREYCYRQLYYGMKWGWCWNHTSHKLWFSIGSMGFAISAVQGTDSFEWAGCNM